MKNQSRVELQISINHMAALYDKFAKEFSRTRRYNRWGGVVDYLKGLDSRSRILDMGCGNGKYFDVREDCLWWGLDQSAELIKECRVLGTGGIMDLVVGDARDTPFDEGAFDCVISVAVLHHMETVEDRRRFVGEMARVCMVGGSVYVTVWARENNTDVLTGGSSKWKALNDEGCYDVMWNNRVPRYYHLFTEKELRGLFEEGSWEVKEVTWQKNNWHLRAIRV